MNQIQNRDDIILLIDEFYKQVIVDPVIGHFFNEVIQLNWDKHIPIMYDFWESVLFGITKYKGNPMLKHIALNKKTPLESFHFERWLLLWTKTVNENFVGEKADNAISKAETIGGLMKYKIGQQSSVNINEEE